MVALATRSKPRRSLDWRRAARLWAAGVAPDAIAAAMGIEEDYFWSHLARSTRFRRFVGTAVYGSRRERDELVNLVGNKLQISTSKS